MLWAWAALVLRHEWSDGGALPFGWAMLALASLVWWRQWRCRPAAAPSGIGRRWAVLGVVALAVIAIPARWLAEANPDWRLPPSVIAAAAAAGALMAHGIAGGRAWTRHFAVACLLPLASVPWPARIEDAIATQGASAVANSVALVLGLGGVPAIARGAVLELPHGPVGVEEACSGLRGTQTAFLASLALGALLRLRPRRLAALMAIAPAVAFVTNVGRVAALAMAHEAGGPANLDRWHDRVGLSAMALLLIAVWLVADRLAPRRSGPRHAPARPVTAEIPWPWRRLAAVALALLATEATVAGWYRGSAAGTPDRPMPRLSFPTTAPGFTELRLPETARHGLRCQAAEAAAWRGADGARWTVHVLAWETGRAALQLARAHHPAACFQARGRLFAGRGESAACLLPDGNRLVFEHWQFRDAPGAGPVGEPSVHVFFARWNGYGEGAVAEGDNAWSWRTRWRLAWAGRRPAAQRVFEVAVRGPRTVAEATERFLAEATPLFSSGPG